MYPSLSGQWKYGARPTALRADVATAPVCPVSLSSLSSIYASRSTSISSIPFIRHGQHGVLLNPSLYGHGVKADGLAESDEGDAALTDHGIQGMDGQAGPCRGLLNRQERVLWFTRCSFHTRCCVCWVHDFLKNGSLVIPAFSLCPARRLSALTGPCW